jgi:segregation and condensation protein B
MRSVRLALDVELVLEALLFVADGPVSVSDLARVIDAEPPDVTEALEQLSGRLLASGIRLQRDRDRVRLVSAPEAAPYVEEFLGVVASSKLSNAALETLAIVAYHQPVTRARVEGIRGVSCDQMLRTLVARNLVSVVGRLEQAGRPMLYATTFEFLDHFGLYGVEELPPLELGDARERIAPSATGE